jgi:hypothetical protein
MIYERLKKRNQLDKMRELNPLKNYGAQSHPARQINEASTKPKLSEAKSK